MLIKILVFPFAFLIATSTALASSMSCQFFLPINNMTTKETIELNRGEGVLIQKSDFNNSEFEIFKLSAPEFKVLALQADQNSNDLLYSFRLFSIFTKTSTVFASPQLMGGLVVDRSLSLVDIAEQIKCVNNFGQLLKINQVN